MARNKALYKEGRGGKEHQGLPKNCRNTGRCIACGRVVKRGAEKVTYVHNDSFVCSCGASEVTVRKVEVS